MAQCLNQADSRSGLGFSDLLGDWLNIAGKCFRSNPLTVGKVISDFSTTPCSIEMGVYVAQVYPQLRLAVVGIVCDFLDQIAQVLMRIIKVVKNHGPANWIFRAIDHGLIAYRLSYTDPSGRFGLNEVLEPPSQDSKLGKTTENAPSQLSPGPNPFGSNRTTGLSAAAKSMQ